VTWSRRPAGAVPRGLVIPALATAFLPALITAALAGCAVRPAATLAPVWVDAVTPAPMVSRTTAYDPPRPAPSLRLTDGNGDPFDLASLRGRPVFVYFGYTHCPDVCPSTLADLRSGIRASGVADATVVFVTIDPERDDAAAMRQYTDFYAMGFIGLTGSPEEIAVTAEAWAVTYQKLASASAGGYAMAHSTDSYLVDRDGMLRHKVFFGAPAELIAALLRETAGG
jgi:protein SCO1/2